MSQDRHATGDLPLILAGNACKQRTTAQARCSDITSMSSIAHALPVIPRSMPFCAAQPKPDQAVRRIE